MTEPRADAADLRLVLPAVLAWLVAWQGAVLSARALGWASAAMAVAAALVLAAAAALRSRLGPPGGATGLRALRPGVVTTAAAILLCASAAACSTGAHVRVRTSGPLPGLAARSAAVSLLTVISDDPRLAAARTGSSPLVVVRVRADLVRAGGRATRVRAPLLVLSNDLHWLGLLPSQQVAVAGLLRSAEPGDDVAAVLMARGPPQVRSPPSRLQAAAGRLRAGLRAAVAPLPEDEAGLLPGLVVGDVSRLPDQLREDFRTVGLTHLTAVSGANIAIILAVVLALAGRVGLGLRWRPVLGGVALVGFVVLARPSPSVLRAAAMGVVGLLALATGGRRRAVPALAGAVLLLLLISPDLASSPGFALSVLATGGLLVFAPPWREALARRVPGWLADALAVPAAAQVACGPVVVALAGTLGILSVPANLLAVPAVAPATVLGVAAALLAPVSLPLAQAAAWLAYPATAWLVVLSRVGARLPVAALPWPDGAPGALLLALCTALVLPALHRTGPRRVLLTVTTALALTFGALAVASPGWPAAGWFVVMCDVGQGDAIVVRTGRAEAVVVDAGPDPDLIDGCLHRLGIRRVPLVVLTHPHADHVDGLAGVLRGRTVGQVEVGPSLEPTAQVRAVAGLARRSGVPVVPVALGEVRKVRGVTWTVLAPLRSYRGTRSDPNNDSIVLRVTSGGSTVLLCGDIEPEAQRDLLASGAEIRSDVLKVPHHGSDHQAPEFLAAVAARVTLTSVGAGNTYGHPSAGTLGQLLAQGSRSYRTDLDGDVALVHQREVLVVRARHGTGVAH